ncbi:hypothetical protein ACOMHN_033206 [Nucella lapillus]
MLLLGCPQQLSEGYRQRPGVTDQVPHPVRQKPERLEQPHRVSAHHVSRAGKVRSERVHVDVHHVMQRMAEPADMALQGFQAGLAWDGQKETGCFI